MGLSLRMTDVADGVTWRWLLTDEETGTPLADHAVRLDPGVAEAAAFEDLYRYLRDNAVPDRRVTSETSLVSAVGAWIGREVLGESVGRAIADAAPVTVRVEVPPEALFRPLELAHVDGAPLASRGDVTLVYDLGRTPGAKTPVTDRLRMLAVFSLPTSTSALALRRERYELSRLIRRIAARERRVVELRVLQYGVTRARLAEVVESEDGWDALHLSGHGGAGAFLLEKPDGSPDPVTTPDLVRLLRPMRRRVKLAVVSACQSAAATTAETLRRLSLDVAAEQLDEQASREAGSALTAIAPELARQLDCAVVAMRYPVTDEFAIALADGLYERLLTRRQPLDVALCRAVAEAAGPSPTAARPAVSVATPAVFGLRATGLSLVPPVGEPELDPSRERMASFPPEPERFVGRAQPMAQASAVLAPESGQTAVILHGMAGAGKTACALELAYRHQDAFAALAFWPAPERGDDFGGALTSLALALEKQLGPYGFTMVDKIGTTEALEAYLPRLRAVLERTGLLLVLDNIETLLTAEGTWRDPRWASLMTALTGHRGESRVILTSRVPPAGVPAAVLPIHSLSLDEAAALARELPNLRALLHDDGGPLRGETRHDRDLARRVLHIVQGHPKLLELADAAARDRARLTAHLDAAETAAPDEGALRAFLHTGISDLDPAQFLDVLARWTADTLTTLPEPAVVLLRMLCRMEDRDRTPVVIGAAWPAVWRGLELSGEPVDPTTAAETLVAAALVHIETLTDGVTSVSHYRVHPGVAETVHATTAPAVRAAVDRALSEFWVACVRAGLHDDGSETSQLVVLAGLNAAPYLIRRHEWDAAAALFELVTQRDDSPATAQASAAQLRNIAAATGSPDHAAMLARTLARSDPAEGERILRTVLQNALEEQDHRRASLIAHELANLLNDRRRLPEALAMAEQVTALSRRAGLGPWRELADQTQRLQILASMGEHRQVLEEVERLRQTMDGLSEQESDSAPPWSIREAIYNAGHTSARALRQWQTALSFNAAHLTSMRNRGTDARQLAEVRFNDYAPLLELGRPDQAEEVVLAYQRVAERYEDMSMLTRAMGARALIESALGRRKAAIVFARTALRYAYTQPDPRDIAICHHNLADELSRLDADRRELLAHGLAATLICGLTGMTYELTIGLTLLARNLADSAVTLTEVVERAEQTEGVRLGALLSTLEPDEQTVRDAFEKIMAAARRQ